MATYTLLSGYEPFYGHDNAQLMAANKDVQYAFHSPEWDHIHSDTKDFIVQCFQKSADSRITPEQAKRHPFIRTSYKAIEMTKKLGLRGSGSGGELSSSSFGGSNNFDNSGSGNVNHTESERKDCVLM